MIKAIVFDIGGVVFDYGPFLEVFLDKAEGIVPLPKFKLKKHLLSQVPALEKGEKNLKGIWRSLVDEKTADKLTSVFVDSYRNNFRKNNEIVKLIQRLREKYIVGCLSNLGREQKEVNEEKGLYRLFSPVVISCDYGVRKPHPRLYRVFIDKIGVMAKECVLIDDDKENIAGARKVRMKGIYFKSTRQLKNSLAKLGIKF